MIASPAEFTNETELLARFVTVPSWIREDLTVRQDAFIPPKDLQLSVTRHFGLIESELWRIGHCVAAQIAGRRQGPLLGRADLIRANVVSQGLKTELHPLRDNPNHVHITDWPISKPEQKAIAQELARLAKYVGKPRET